MSTSAGHSGDETPRRFILYGLSRLSVGVAELLVAQGDVVLVHDPKLASASLDLLDPRVRVVVDTGNHAEALREAGIEQAESLLAVASEDLPNLHLAIIAHHLAPHVPVVLRTFDPVLARDLEQGLNVRRAYSVSALAAPYFVAGILADRVLEALKLGDDKVIVLQWTVRPGSPLEGKTVEALEADFYCSVLATRVKTDVTGATSPSFRTNPRREEVLEQGMEVVVGGRLLDVLRLASLNSRFSCCCSRSALPAFRTPSPAAPRRQWTLVPVAATTLLLVLTVAVVVFHGALSLDWIDAFYFVITTATTTGYGDISLKDAPAWVKLFGSAVMLCGASLIAVLFSYLAAMMTTDRLQEQLGRRAQSLRGHVVLSGLGNVGYRVVSLLSELGLTSVVLERQPDSRFVEAVRKHAIVLSADARSPESLELAGIRTAAAFVACTDDDLANIQAALQSRTLNPDLYTVARISDPFMSENLPRIFHIDRVITPYQSAMRAFAGAAVGEHAARRVQLGDAVYTAFRHQVTTDVPAHEIERWAEDGIRVLAVQRAGTLVSARWPAGGSLASGDAIVVAGPEVPALRLLDGQGPRNRSLVVRPFVC